MLQAKTGGDAAEFVLFMEGMMNAYTADARPPDGSQGQSQLQMLGDGWHGKFSMYSVGFYDGHAEYRFFDTRYTTGPGYDLWPNPRLPGRPAVPDERRLPMRRAKAFTMIELLTVIAIVSILVGISLPNLSRSREEAKRTVCAANERGIGQAFYLYAMEAPDPGHFPSIGPLVDAGSNNVHMFYPGDRTSTPSTIATPSPTVDLWAVVRRVYSVPKQFICPSTTDLPDPVADTTVTTISLRSRT